MAIYIGRRLLQVVPMLLLISLVVFLMIQATPYDVIDSITTPNMSAETIEIIRQRYGPDDPVLVQRPLARQRAAAPWSGWLITRMITHHID